MTVPECAEKCIGDALCRTKGCQAPADRWRLAEWDAIPDVCFIDGCEASETDPRGPVWLRDHGMAKACTEHWEGIMSVLGDQVCGADSYRSGP